MSERDEDFGANRIRTPGIDADAIPVDAEVRVHDARADVPDEDLDRVLEAARIAPSSQNNQPWDFVAVTDRALLRELSNVWQGGGHIANAAAAIAVVIPDETEARARERNRAPTFKSNTISSNEIPNRT